MKTTNRSAHEYNGTAIYTDATGKAYCHGLVQVVDGKVLRSNGHWTSNNGTPAYDADFRRGAEGTLRVGGPGSKLELRLDGGAAFMAQIRRMAG